MRLAPEPPPEIARPLEHVLDRAVGEVAAEPAVVLVEDSGHGWLLEAAALAPDQRARAVVAARTEDALLAAVRLGISGALWLPPSTVTAAAAIARVAEAPPVRVPDPALAELAAAFGDPLLVAVANSPFWRCQLGDLMLSACLADLAAELARPPALVAGPGLVVGGCDEDGVHAAWATITRRRGFLTEGVRTTPLATPVGHCGASMAVMDAMAGAPKRKRAASPGDLPPQPVHELPSGRRVGGWAPHAATAPASLEWYATPTSPNLVGFEWRLELPDGSEAAVTDTVAVTVGAVPPAFRVPGWIGVAAAAGSPAGLLVERMATAAQRAGSPLWLPEVATAALHFVLSLPGAVWIDGPAVPAACQRVDTAPGSP